MISLSEITQGAKIARRSYPVTVCSDLPEYAMVRRNNQERLRSGHGLGGGPSKVKKPLRRREA